MNRTSHWNKVFASKPVELRSWYEQVPTNSINSIRDLELDKDASIIDIGAGTSYLPDYLLSEGFKNLFVLDISLIALNNIKARIKSHENQIKFIEADVAEWGSDLKFDLWHDRAAFHFLTKQQEIDNYLNLLKNNIVKGGFLIISTFSEKGPDQCSNLNVQKYSIAELTELLSHDFNTIECKNIEHLTPKNISQSFTFGSFKKNKSIDNIETTNH